MRKDQSITADITWNALYTPDTLHSLLAKIPGNMKDIWNRLTYNLRRHQEMDAEFADLVNFVEEETILVTDPMFSRDALDSVMDNAKRPDHRSRGVKTCNQTRHNRGRGKMSKPMSYM